MTNTTAELEATRLAPLLKSNYSFPIEGEVQESILSLAVAPSFDRGGCPEGATRISLDLPSCLVGQAWTGVILKQWAKRTLGCVLLEWYDATDTICPAMGWPETDTPF